jgi:hypothetical protein
MRAAVTYVLAFVLLVVSAGARAAEVSVALGWSGLYRPGEWAPLFVTVSGVPGATDGQVEVRSFQDSRSTVILSADIPLQANRATFCVPILMGSIEDAASVTVRDKATGKPIGTARIGDLPASERVAVGTRGNGAGMTARLVVVAGGHAGIGPGDMLGIDFPTARLPTVGELYDSVDLLVFAESTLAELSPEQNAAILGWVAAGGKVMVCVPAEGIQLGGELERVLPADVGDLRPMPGSAARVLAPRAGAKSVEVGSGVSGAVRDFGLGKILELPYPLTLATRASAGRLLGELRPRISAEPPPVREPTHSIVPTLGLVLLTVGLLLGPVEAVVRRAHDVWPWRWWVTLGSVVALAGGFTLAVSQRDPPPSVDAIHVTEQVGGQRVAESDWDAVASGRGLPRVIFARDHTTVAHRAVEMQLDDGLPRLLSNTGGGAPGGAAVLVRRLASGDALFAVANWDGHSLQVTEPAGQTIDEVAVETPTGAVALHRAAIGWEVDHPTGALAPNFAVARQLTPALSGLLQYRIAHNEGVVVWTRSGNQYTRTWLRK